jgi:hypothetical protein
MISVSPEVRWLLDRASDAKVPVALVLPGFYDQREQWNTPCPNWTHHDLFASLRFLEGNGLIEFHTSGPGEDEQTPTRQPELEPRLLVRSYRNRGARLIYRLTSAGGLLWEQLAKPDWSRKYVDPYIEASSHEEPVEYSVTACTEETVRRALLIRAYTSNLLIVPGSELYQPCGEWQATYWKTIHEGVRVTALVAELPEGLRLSHLLPAATMRHEYENCLYLHRWYEPADDAAW